MLEAGQKLVSVRVVHDIAKNYVFQHLACHTGQRNKPVVTQFMSSALVKYLLFAMFHALGTSPKFINCWKIAVSTGPIMFQ